MSNILFCQFCHRTYNLGRKICPMDGSSLNDIPSKLPEIGDSLDKRYIIISEIGSGGMGAIFKAYDSVIKRDVALKVLKPELTHREEAIRRFFIEARSAKCLNHPNIVVIFDFGCSIEGYLHISMELLEGSTLAAELQNYGRLPLHRILRIGLSITDALHIAHLNGVVHRDLKPENIALLFWDNEGDFVKVLDFGIAAIHEEKRKNSRKELEIIGTPGYMSPEQIKGQEVDGRSDLYSLGIILYEMLVGKCPFDGDEPYEIMKAHLSKDFPPLPSSLGISHSLTLKIENLLKSLLEKDKKNRPENVHIVKNKLFEIGMDYLEEEGMLNEENKDSIISFHSRKTLPLKKLSQYLFNCQPTLVHNNFNDGRTLLSLPEQDFNTIISFKACPYCNYRNEVPEKFCQRCEKKIDEEEVTQKIKDTPWTLNNNTNPIYFSSQNRSDFIKLTLLHIKFDFEGGSDEGVFTIRALFEPEIEAWSIIVQARGGFLCFDSGNEIRCIFGLRDSFHVQSIEALRAAIDLKNRIENFKKQINQNISFCAGISTGFVPRKSITLDAIDLSLRGSAIDLAARLTNIANEKGIYLDESCARYVIRKYKLIPTSSIKVRGQPKEMKVFAFME